MVGSGVKPAAACLLGQAKRHALMPTFATHPLPDAKEAGGRYRRESHKIAYTPHRNATVIARLGGLGLAQDGARGSRFTLTGNRRRKSNAAATRPTTGASTNASGPCSGSPPARPASR